MIEIGGRVVECGAHVQQPLVAHHRLALERLRFVDFVGVELQHLQQSDENFADFVLRLAIRLSCGPEL